MKNASIISLLVLVSLVTVTVCTKAVKKYSDDAVSGTPTCFNGERNVICLFLQASDMGLLEQCLIETALIVPLFDVQIEASDGPAIPVDIFSGYSIDDVYLFNDNFPTVPYELLSSFESSVVGLFLDYYNFTSKESAPPDRTLAFSDYLTTFEMMETNIEKISPDMFASYTKLQTLVVSDNSIKSIGFELLNLGTLLNVDYSINDVATIETGAFRDLKRLKYLQLAQNNLTTLQEGAFSGLETSPITYINLSLNPWNCTCELQWLKDWLNVRGLAETSEATCQYPEVGYFNDISFC